MTHGLPSGWTDERTEALKGMWAKGLSASEIARELGGVTRNAVCGKIDRLGLSGRKEAAIGARISEKRRQVRSAATAVVPNIIRRITAAQVSDAVPIDDLAIPEAQRRSILSVRERECRWPVNHPGDPDFFLCGAPTAIGQPYCAGHLRRAWATPQPRKATRSWQPWRAA